MPTLIGQIVQDDNGAIGIHYDHSSVPQKIMASLLLGLAAKIVQDLDEPKIEEPSKVSLV